MAQERWYYCRVCHIWVCDDPKYADKCPFCSHKYEISRDPNSMMFSEAVSKNIIEKEIKNDRVC